MCISCCSSSIKQKAPWLGLCVVQTQAICWLGCITIWIIQIINSKYSRGTIRSTLSRPTHARSHAERRQAIAIVIVHQHGLDSVLTAVHKRILITESGAESAGHHARVPIPVVLDGAGRSLNVIVKSAPRGVGSRVTRVEFPSVNVALS